MAEGSRAARLVFIKELLMERPYTIEELVSRCRVSRYTIQRDLIVLQLRPLCLPLVVENDRWRVLGRKT